MSSIVLTFDVYKQGTGYDATIVPNLSLTTFNATLDAAVSPDPGLQSDSQGVVVEPTINVVTGTLLRIGAVYQGMANYCEPTTE